MSAMRPLSAMVLVVLALAACDQPVARRPISHSTGLPVPSPTTPDPEESDEPVYRQPKSPKAEAPSRWTGKKAEVYDLGFRICEAFTVKEIAKEFGTAKDPVSAAEGYAEGFQLWARQPAFEGCLDGLNSQ